MTRRNVPRRAVMAAIAAGAAVCGSAFVPFVGTLARAAFPGRNGAIAFVAIDTDQSGYTDIVAQDPMNSHRATTIYNGGYGSNVAAPAYSPNGREVMFVLGRGLYLATRPARRPTLIPNTRKASSGAWAPGGNKIVFSAHGNIYKLTLGGSATPTLLRRGATEPTWSVRGEIAYVHAGTIYEMSASGGPSKRLGATASACSPDWSPDGRELALAEGPDCDVVDGDTSSGLPGKGPVQIYTIGADGTGLTRITDGSFYNQFPAFSPDGTEIAFSHTSTRFPNDTTGNVQGQRLWVMNADGTNAHQITDNEGGTDAGEPGLAGDVQPSWQPLPR